MPMTQEERRDRDSAIALAAGAGTGIAANKAKYPIGGALYRSLVRNQGKQTSLNLLQLRQLREELSPTTKLEYLRPTLDRLYGRLQGAHYNPYDDTAYVKRTLLGGASSGATAAHELGHANLHQRFGNLVTVPSMISRVIQANPRLGTAVAGSGALAGAIADEDSRLGDAAQYVGAAAMAPMLADEAYASIKGYGALKKYLKTAAERRAARRHLLKAFGTYGAAASPIIVAPIAARQIKKRLAEREG